MSIADWTDSAWVSAVADNTVAAVPDSPKPPVNAPTTPPANTKLPIDSARFPPF